MAEEPAPAQLSKQEEGARQIADALLRMLVFNVARNSSQITPEAYVTAGVVAGVALALTDPDYTERLLRLSVGKPFEDTRAGAAKTLTQFKKTLPIA